MSEAGVTTAPDLPGWRFSLREISNGCWQAEGRHTDGRSVSRVGSDESELMKECMRDARHLPEKRKQGNQPTV
jgi:hypothetical protein